MLSNVERAKKLILDSNVTDVEIQRKTGISRTTLNNVRKSDDLTESIEKMKYTNVLNLADMYNDLQINHINENFDNAFYKFVARLGDWFKEAIQDQKDSFDSSMSYPDDLMIANVIQKINDLTTKDKSLMLEMYFVYFSDGMDKI